MIGWLLTSMPYTCRHPTVPHPTSLLALTHVVDAVHLFKGHPDAGHDSIVGPVYRYGTSRRASLSMHLTPPPFMYDAFCRYPRSPVHRIFRRSPWRRAPPRACGRSCRASRSGGHGSRTWLQLDRSGVPSFSRSWDYRHSYQKALPKTNPRPASRLSASVHSVDAVHSRPRAGARLTKANAEIKDEAPTEHLAAGQPSSHLCGSLPGVRRRLGSAATEGANGWRQYVHR
jgi:hypothetical protein